MSNYPIQSGDKTKFTTSSMAAGTALICIWHALFKVPCQFSDSNSWPEDQYSYRPVPLSTNEKLTAAGHIYRTHLASLSRSVRTGGLAAANSKGYQSSPTMIYTPESIDTTSDGPPNGKVVVSSYVQKSRHWHWHWWYQSILLRELEGSVMVVRYGCIWDIQKMEIST